MNAHLAKMLMAMNHPSLPGIDLSLDRMVQLLAALGNPQRRVPPVIHVAGTNGKGSTIAYLRAIYRAAGYCVHAYTSPHLVRFNERIVIADQIIDDDLLLGYLQRVTDACRTIPATFFEATTAAAFLAFTEHTADILLLETGLGGRLDATNVITHPLCTVITPIDFDHMEFLGDNLEKIAAEKAGIMKRGIPCIAAAQQPKAAEILARRSDELRAPLQLGGRDWHYSDNEQGMLLQYEHGEIQLPPPNLPGAHQHGNAALAAMVARACAGQLPVADAAIREGIARVEWPARLQKLSHGPVVELWGSEVYLDGGHNPHAATAIADWINQRAEPIVLLCAMMQRKDAQAYFAEIAPSVAAICCIPMPKETAGYPANVLAHAARAAGIMQVSEAVDMLSAARALQAFQPATLLIAGSLHLAGEVLKNHG